MEEIRREDRRLFVRELFEPSRLIILAPLFLFLSLAVFSDSGPNWTRMALFALLPSLVLWSAAAYRASTFARFKNPRTRSLWNACSDRLLRFEEAIKKMRTEQIADLQEMPSTIRRVSGSIYLALRRADSISSEIQKTEKGLYSQPPVWSQGAHDPQSQELYQLADRNIAEYRANVAAVMAGVERAEAQSAVFVTTVDTLRMRMIGYRLAGKRPEIDSHDLMEAMSEAKSQLRAIDTALEELELGPYPKMVSSAVPPPPPDEYIQRRIGS